MWKITYLRIINGQLTLEDIKSYIVGTYRTLALKYGLPVRKHIKQQFQMRRKLAAECEELGHCKVCGCKTPDLFMADKACEGGCYEPMMTKKQWNEKI